METPSWWMHGGIEATLKSTYLLGLLLLLPRYTAYHCFIICLYYCTALSRTYQHHIHCTRLTLLLFILGRPSASVVRGDRGDAPQARGEARRNNAPRIAGEASGQHEARARMRLACASREARGDRLYALIVCGAGRVTIR